MDARRLSWLLLLLFFVFPTSSNAQGKEADCAGFVGWYKQKRFGGWELSTWCLTLRSDLLQFDDLSPASFEKKPSFAIQISDLASLERSKLHSWRGLLIKLKDGKKFEFYRINPNGPGAGQEEAVQAVEKAIRDMASQRGVVLK